jgi:hypothetical protein
VQHRHSIKPYLRKPSKHDSVLLFLPPIRFVNNALSHSRSELHPTRRPWQLTHFLDRDSKHHTFFFHGEVSGIEWRSVIPCSAALVNVACQIGVTCAKRRTGKWLSRRRRKERTKWTAEWNRKIYKSALPMCSNPPLPLYHSTVFLLD